MSVTLKRRITRIGIAIDVLALAALVILDRSGRSPSWGADVATAACFTLSVVTGLLYLKKTGA